MSEGRHTHEDTVDERCIHRHEGQDGSVAIISADDMSHQSKQSPTEDLRNDRIAVSTTISFNDFRNSSCSVMMCGSPVSARSRFALLSRIAGAYVSGIVAHIQATMSANIMLTCRVHVKFVSSNGRATLLTQKIHRQPTVSPMKLPTIGPRTGPLRFEFGSEFVRKN